MRIKEKIRMDRKKLVGTFAMIVSEIAIIFAIIFY